MSKFHTARTLMTFDIGSAEGFIREVEVRFTYRPDSAEIEVDAIYLIGDDDEIGQFPALPDWMVGMVCDDSELHDWLRSIAEEDRAAEADDWAEMKADEARGN